MNERFSTPVGQSGWLYTYIKYLYLSRLFWGKKISLTVRKSIWTEIGPFEMDMLYSWIVYLNSSRLKNIDKASSGPNGCSNCATFPVESSYLPREHKYY